MPLKDGVLEPALLLKPNDYIKQLAGPSFFIAEAAVVDPPVVYTITHTWKDINLLRHAITHSWGVITDHKSFPITHTWRVRSVRNPSITHRWRVLEPGTTEAFSDDIQLPYSEQEIETE